MKLKMLEALLTEMPMPRSKKVKQNIVDLAKKGLEDDDTDDFAFEFSQEYNSAIEIWMGRTMMKKLMKLLVDGKQVTTLSSGERNYNPDAGKKSMEARGWKLFDEEYNGDSYEAVFYKD